MAICYNQGEDRARKLLAELPKGNHRVTHLELTDVASVRRMGDELRDAFGRVDVLVNSAGMTRPIPHADLDALDEAFFDQVLIANARGPYSVIRTLLPLLRAGRAIGGRERVLGRGVQRPGQQHRLWRVEGGTRHDDDVAGPRASARIRFLCVSPGPVATDFVAGRGREQIAKIMATAPLRRVIEPEEIASAMHGLRQPISAPPRDEDRGGWRPSPLTQQIIAARRRRRDAAAVSPGGARGSSQRAAQAGPRDSGTEAELCGEPMTFGRSRNGWSIAKRPCRTGSTHQASMPAVKRGCADRCA